MPETGTPLPQRLLELWPTRTSGTFSASWKPPGQPVCKDSLLQTRHPAVGPCGHGAAKLPFSKLRSLFTQLLPAFTISRFTLPVSPSESPSVTPDTWLSQQEWPRFLLTESPGHKDTRGLAPPLRAAWLAGSHTWQPAVSLVAALLLGLLGAFL